MPSKMKDEWYVGGECKALLEHLEKRVVTGSCVLQVSKQ